MCVETDTLYAITDQLGIILSNSAVVEPTKKIQDPGRIEPDKFSDLYSAVRETVPRSGLAVCLVELWRRKLEGGFPRGVNSLYTIEPDQFSDLSSAVRETAPRSGLAVCLVVWWRWKLKEVSPRCQEFVRHRGSRAAVEEVVFPPADRRTR